MSSKRHLRRKLENTCKRKKPYPTLAIALDNRRYLIERHPAAIKLSAYHCDFCGRYHLGHPNHKIIQSIRARREGV